MELSPVFYNEYIKKYAKRTLVMVRRYLESHRRARQVFTALYRVLPMSVFVIYGLMVICLYANNDMRLYKVIEVPFVVFAGITVIRKCINAPRPYEVTGVPPLVKKDKKGQSFPSRHVVSAVVISIAGLYLNIWLGVILLMISFIIAIMRVVAGVHFVKDVAAGFAISIIAGAIGFFV